MSVELCIGDCSESRDWLFFIVQLVVAIGTLTAVGVAALAARSAFRGLKREEEGRRASLRPLLKIDGLPEVIGDEPAPLGLTIALKNFGPGPAQEIEGKLWVQYNPGFNYTDIDEMERRKQQWSQRPPHYRLTRNGLGAGELASHSWIAEESRPPHSSDVDILIIYMLDCVDVFDQKIPGPLDSALHRNS